MPRAKTATKAGIKSKKVIIKTQPKIGIKPSEKIGLSAGVFDHTGKKTGNQKLSQTIFGAKPNDQLLLQAIRIYETNMLTHNAHTKTRGETRGGGAKPWRQKGTGNARAGSRRSPLWVGGGITFGPRSRKVKLNFPQKMKHLALITALSQKSKEGNIHIVSDLEKIKPKTKNVANLIQALGFKGKTLLLVSAKNQNINLASRNIQNLNVNIVSNLNAYEVLKAANLVFSKEAIGILK